MNISINTSESSAQCRIYGIYQFDQLDNISEDVKENIKVYIRDERFKGEEGELYAFTKEKKGSFVDVILVGLGKQEKLEAEKIRAAYGKALKKAKELKVKSLDINMLNTKDFCKLSAFKAILEGLCFANYKFNKYKSQKSKDYLEEINIVNIAEGDFEEIKKQLEETKVLVQATLTARDLINEPANIMTPEVLADRAKEIGQESGFEVEIFDEKQIENFNMKAFLSVAQGSDNAPKLIVMRYFGDSEHKDNILGLVGKGLTYDSGGYSVKSTEGMLTMKSDMGGAAAVICALSAIAKMKLKVNVVAVAAACENMISGKAYKPGDIIGSMAGKTIEVMNTDAEGRLTLADAVYYAAEKEKASKIVDIATLTGAVLIGLGNSVTGVVTNDEEFLGELRKASDKAGERIWQLPSFEDYKKLIKSDIADLKNTGGRLAGTITAGLFIGEFVKEKPWLHLDIAGTSWSDSDKEYFSKGATGAGVRSLYYLAKEQSK